MIVQKLYFAAFQDHTYNTTCQTIRLIHYKKYS